MTVHGFTLYPSEQAKLHKWMAEQDAILKDQKYEGAIGGRFTYSFTPTSLGCVVTVRDDLTDNEIDVTDYSMW